MQPLLDHCMHGCTQVKSVPRPERCQLKYAVEVQIPKSTPMLGLLEPLLERVVFEDLPHNLAALKERIEQIQTQKRIAALEGQGELACE